MPEPPVVACSLTQDQMKSRTDVAARIGRAGLLEVSTSGCRADFVFAGPDVARSDIDEFVDAESKCCPFFKFEVKSEGVDIHLRIEAPEDGAPLTRGLVAGFTDGWRLSQ